MMGTGEMGLNCKRCKTTDRRNTVLLYVTYAELFDLHFRHLRE